MRQPAVADRFYPGSSKTLSLAITELFPTTQPARKTKALAVVSPHAGYVYSGALAAKTFYTVEVPETVIILGPNHHGQGAPISLSTITWDMPFGKVPVDMEIVDHLLEISQHIRVDEIAHQFEHSLEVQIPFLQMLQKNLSIVPLVLSRISYSLCEEIAESLATAINESNKDLLIVASSDMTHYESRISAERKDRSALKCIERLDPYDLYHTVLDNHISMCGVIPVVIALLAAKSCGAKQASLIGYTDSGYISGDANQVVGYAGIVIE
jgi:MEMO1 family protein